MLCNLSLRISVENDVGVFFPYRSTFVYFQDRIFKMLLKVFHQVKYLGVSDKMFFQPEYCWDLWLNEFKLSFFLKIALLVLAC